MSIFLFDSGQGHSACFVGTSLPRRLGRWPCPQQRLGLALELLEGGAGWTFQWFPGSHHKQCCRERAGDTDR